MKSQYNNGDIVATRRLLSPNEASNARNVIHLIELLANCLPQEYTNKAFAKTIDCSPQTVGGAVAEDNTYTITDRAEVKLVHT